MELLILTCLASFSVATAAFHSASSSSSGLIALRAQSLTSVAGYSLHVDDDGEAAHFGDTRCPCIGFDNIEGETTVVFEDENGKDIDEVAYPADLGARCEAWDNSRHRSCRGSDPKAKWCKEAWCYVDPCNCKIPVLPKMSAYSPDALYRGKPLFYSYATCGGKDMWTKGVPEVGTPGCRCIGFDNVPGTTEMVIAGKAVPYPAEVGGSCQAWDKEAHPECKSDKPPKWCFKEWCYVDPCSCSLAKETPPKISAYLPDATFTGKSLYYSYETCGNKDHYTEHHHHGACVNQKNEDDCTALVRCAWTGTQCLGAELINHPLCKGVASDYLPAGEEDGEAKSAAWLAAPSVVSAVALLAAGL